jgi:hypothetical protein
MLCRIRSIETLFADHNLMNVQAYVRVVDSVNHSIRTDTSGEMKKLNRSLH